MSTDEQLLVELRQAARRLTEKNKIRDLDVLLSQVVDLAVRLVPGADAGGISVTTGEVIESRHPTSEAVRTLDRVQSELHQGPAITAVVEPPPDGVVIAQDLAGDGVERWPDFAPHAVEAGFRSSMSAELTMNGGLRAALTLWSERVRAFDARARLIAGVYGVQAAVLLHGAEQAAFIQRAVESRDLIGQAKGILMERFAVDDGEAFRMLSRSSQDSNTKLVEVARSLVTEAGRLRAARDVPTDGR